LIIKSTLISILGETFMRFRIKLIEKTIFQGGVTRNDALTDGFIDLMYRAGEQRGRYRSLISLFRNGKKHVMNIKTSIFRLKLFMVIRTGRKRMNVNGQSMRFQIPHQ